jgi:MFS family permease
MAGLMAEDEKKTWRDSLAVLGPGPYRRYIMGETVSMTGTWMQAMAQGYIMTTLTSSALMLGLVSFASGIPTLLLTMAGGSAADRLDKRWILIVTLVIQIVLALVTGYLVLTKQIQLWHVMAMAVGLGVATAFEMPAAAAFVPEIVKKEQIRDAIAIDRAIFHGTRLVGPATAGMVVAVWGAATAFFLNALSFLPLIGALLTIKARTLGTPEEEAKRAGGMKEGFDFVRQDKPTLAMIVLMSLQTIFVFPVFAVMLPLYATQVLKSGAEGMGLLASASGVGSLIGTLALLTILPSQRLGRMGLAAGALVLALAGLAWAQTLWIGLAAMAMLSGGVSTMFGLANTIVQERAPDYLRGRVSAVAGLSFFGLMPFAGLGITALSDVIGMRLTLGISAAVYGVVALVVLAGPGGRAVRAASVEPGEA